MTQLSAGRLDRFDPATGNLDSFYGVSNPIHFEFFQDKAYVTSSQSAAAVNVIDPKLGAPFRDHADSADARRPKDGKPHPRDHPELSGSADHLRDRGHGPSGSRLPGGEQSVLSRAPW